MRIAIIGGGAAGMISAHYLSQHHQVTVIEREPILGGNVRTLNGNVATKNIPPEICIDNGVIEFHRYHSPALQEVMHDLGLKLIPVSGGSTALFLEGGQSFYMPGAISAQDLGWGEALWRYTQLAQVLCRFLPSGLRLALSRNRATGSIGELLGRDPLSNWIRMLLMYGYSIPFDMIDQFPSRLAIPTLAQGAIGTRWVSLPGGVYQYIQKIIDNADEKLSILTGQNVITVQRNEQGVTVCCDRQELQADKLVFATPPDQVLQLLAEPDSKESTWFSPWRENTATTVIHTDTSIYAPWGDTGYTEFDMFEKAKGADAGYNAYLNRLCGLSADHPTKYFLAYNLEGQIDPQRILHRQQHRTPFYSVDAQNQVDAIKAGNGRNNTYYSGAYLYNGLHEGAAQSALALRALLAR